MATVGTVALIVLGVLLLIALLGAIAATRRNRARADTFSENLTAVDRHLAAAIAEDHGWRRETLDAAARAAFAEQRPGAEPTGFELIQVVDEPGTDADLAVYRVTVAGQRPTRLTLGRRDGAWYAASVEDE